MVFFLSFPPVSYTHLDVYKRQDMTREALVKIERGIQHIQLSQLKGIRDVLQTTYDELLEIH